MKSRIVEVTGKMPFAGKYFVKNLFLTGRNASLNAETQTKVGASLGLGAFAALHAVQLKLGISELVRDGGQPGYDVAIDAAYTSANAMATYTQAYLAVKIMRTRERIMEPALTPAIEHMTGELSEGIAEEPVITPASNLDEVITDINPVDFGVSLAVTLGGQMLFMATQH